MKHDKLIAIDLAKSVFQVCVLDDTNSISLNKQFTRTRLQQFLAQQEPSTIVMEACYSSHYWGRLCQELGHNPKLIPAQHVKPFLRGNKNDANDALAIAEASRPPKSDKRQIGPIVSTAMLGSVDVKNHFQSARKFAVWLGLTPRQSSSGGRSIMLRITKRGDRYLRKQLIHAARAAMRTCRGRDDRFSQWVNKLIAGREFNKACVALAHKMARLSWILLQRNEPFAIDQ